MMDLSIVIPTYNRPGDLGETLSSIAGQEALPSEVLVVDSSDSEETHHLIKKRAGEFPTSLRYYRNSEANNLTTSRNIGIERTDGDVLLFLDDDVILDAGYLGTIWDFLSSNPEAKGAQGYWGPDSEDRSSAIRTLLARVFLLSRIEKGPGRILRSGRQTYPLDSDEPVRCEWLSGCNMAYRREVFDELRFDERLKRGSYGEDWDFSYRVHRRWEGSLWMIPSARLVHKGSPTSRAPVRELVHLREAYSAYLFHKNIEDGPINRWARAWSHVGQALRFLGRGLFSRTQRGYHQDYLSYWLESRQLVRRNRERLRRADLGFLNELEGH